jgi:hypothetical protein
MSETKLSGEEYVALQTMIGNSALVSGLMRIAEVESREKHKAMESEALGSGKASEIIKLAAEGRAWREMLGTIKRRMESMAPQSR